MHIHSRFAVIVTYCVDGDSKPNASPHTDSNRSNAYSGRSGSSERTSMYKGNKQYNNQQQSSKGQYAGNASGSNLNHYTLADVPRLAEYSANVYASTVEEHDHYYKYYTDYYVNEINQGNFAGLPTINQISETANSGAAVALSAIQRKQKQQHRESSATPSCARDSSQKPIILPTGRDNKKYRKCTKLYFSKVANEM